MNNYKKDFVIDAQRDTYNLTRDQTSLGLLSIPPNSSKGPIVPTPKNPTTMHKPLLATKIFPSPYMVDEVGTP